MDKKYAKYLLDKTKNDYNLIAEDFSRTRENIWEEIRFLFDDYLTAGEKVLDLGCGNGRFYELFKNKDVQYFGIDNSEKLIEIAKKKYPKADFRTGEALKLPFPNNYFNKVYSIAVLHHVPSTELRVQFLKETKRILRPGGKLILTAWNFHDKKERFLLLKYTILKIIGKNKMDFRDILEPWADKTKRYYHWFSKRELAKIVKKAGFKIETIGVIKNKTGSRQNIYLVAAK
jgi:ubiquinone/menaquinone biosynthesis C-methylase UbiE